MRRSTKIALGSGLAATALVGAFGMSTWLWARRTIAFHLADATGVLEGFAPETTRRPAILEPEEPGDAWDLLMEFQAGTTQLGALHQDPPSVHRFSMFPSPEETVFGEVAGSEAFAEMEARLDLLRRALRRSRVTPQRRPGAFTYGGIQGDSIDTLFGLVQKAVDAGNPEAALERIVLAQGWTQDLARHGDRDLRGLLWDAEVESSRIARSLFRAQRPSSATLALAARRLDRLRSARPPLSFTLRIDSAIERRFVVDPDFLGAMFSGDALGPTRPTWKDLWSAAIHDAKRVTILQAAARSLDGIEALPSWERRTAALRSLEPFEGGVCQSWELPYADDYARDAAALTCLELFRIAVAIARSEADRGAFPAALSDLVPDFLPAIPASPFCGRPFFYEAGRVWIDGLSLDGRILLPDDQLDWRMQRTSPK